MDRKLQLNWEQVNRIHQTDFSQQLIGVVLLRLQLALKRRAIRQTAEQIPVIALQPPTKGAEVPTLQCKDYPNRHHFTRIQLGLRYFLTSTIWSSTQQKNMDDNVFCRHVDTLPLVSSP